MSGLQTTQTEQNSSNNKNKKIKYKFYDASSDFDKANAEEVTQSLYNTTKVPIVGQQYRNEDIYWFAMNQPKGDSAVAYSLLASRFPKDSIRKNVFSGTPVNKGAEKYVYYKPSNKNEAYPNGFIEAIVNNGTGPDTTMYVLNNKLSYPNGYATDIGKLKEFLSTNATAETDPEQIEAMREILYNKKK